jgi:hypothetical protein
MPSNYSLARNFHVRIGGVEKSIVTGDRLRTLFQLSGILASSNLTSHAYRRNRSQIDQAWGDSWLLITLVTFSTPKLPSRLMKMGRGLFARADLAMSNGGQPEVQHRLRTLSQRREELSAVPARLETNLQGHLLSSLAKSIRG